MTNEPWPVFLGIIVVCTLLMGLLFFLGAVGDEIQEHFDNGCLVTVHKNNHLFDKDTVKITRYCK